MCTRRNGPLQPACALRGGGPLNILHTVIIIYNFQAMVPDLHVHLIKYNSEIIRNGLLH